jgi:D-alanyl-D-alanine carboxypeptidase (penicillin-binding protein 5/6)
VFLIIAVLIVFSLVSYLRPLPILKPTKQPVDINPSAAVELPWPIYGQAALGAAGYGVLATHGAQTAVPTASLAKIVTALSVLQKKPLAAGQQGPDIVITQEDQAAYDAYFAQGGSIVAVAAGEKISEYQALQALLIPSANNFADTLARWAFGSINNYTAYANQLAKKMGLSQTHITDASGLAPATVSSSQDLVKLGLVALDNPVIMSIAGQSEATIPVAGVIRNTNGQLGANGVIGLKTGNTDQAGGCYLFAAKRVVGQQPVTLVGAIMGAPDLVSALLSATPLIKAADGGFQNLAVVKAGQSVGNYKLPWGGNAAAVAKTELQMLVWRGSLVTSSITLVPVRPPVAQGTQVGIISATAGGQTKKTAAILAQSIKGPALSWRLFH